MIWMYDYHVLCVIDYDLTTLVEVSNDMNVRAGSTMSVDPCLPQGDGFAALCRFIFDEKDLLAISTRLRAIQKAWYAKLTFSDCSLPFSSAY